MALTSLRLARTALRPNSTCQSGVPAVLSVSIYSESVTVVQSMASVRFRRGFCLYRPYASLRGR